MASTDTLSSLERYSIACEDAAGRIISAYSTSFGTATALLGARHRRHVRNLYALVRVADELVDGVAAQVGMGAAEQRQQLDALEQETEAAMRSGYSSNPVVHAFARTAREADIGPELTRPFFASMRMDLPADGASEPASEPASEVAAEPVAGAPATASSAGIRAFDQAEHAVYVHGSAEVVGLMCLRVFMRGEARSEDQLRRLDYGARQLGAAFQNVNFLRDLGDDTERLGRGYLGAEVELTPEQQQRWILTIRRQLTDAEAVLPLLPGDARGAVGCALRFFAKLTDQLERTPADGLRERRARVSNPVKVWLALRALVSARRVGLA